MNVIRAEVLGYCMGVERAVRKARDALGGLGAEYSRVFSLGPLIHNPCVLKEFSGMGLSVLSPEDLSLADGGSAVVIRAHGTTPQVMARLKEQGALVVDATCPRVLASQRRAAEWAARGCTVFVAGDRNHGEVTSICAHAASASALKSDAAVVVQDADEARAARVPEKSVLLAQTTFSPSEFETISGLLLEKNPGLKVFNSICSATLERQKALLNLKGKCDGILVIGGRNSANTLRLAQTAASICGKTALIEDASEIPGDFFTLGTVALTAGASTPESLIEQVQHALESHADSVR